jgi:DivIVA domain-containing protein
MELSPQAVAAATFKTVKRGYDPDEVRSYLIEVSGSLEASQQQATAMEARARAAIAKLQDASQHTGGAPVGISDDTENISRTLLLAQRTADAAVADANSEAATIRSAATLEAATITSAARAEAVLAVDQAQAAAARLLEEAKEEVRRAKTDEHVRAEAEFNVLVAKRATLLADVEHLEHHVATERERIRSASAVLVDIVERVPSGLGAVPRPIVSSLTNDGTPTPPPSLITGQVPLTPGLEPLVSPRPTSDDQVRTMWQEAERADLAGSDEIDTTPPNGVSPDDLA